MEITINSTKTGKLSLFVKSMIIAGMAVFLWIPTNLILDLVRERESRQREAVADISNKWAGKQTLTAPVLAILQTTVLVNQLQ
jgi:inner membrane protein